MKTKLTLFSNVLAAALIGGISSSVLAQDKDPAPDAKPDNVDSKMFYHQTSTFKGHEGSVRGLDWSPDGKMLASCGDDNFVKVWDRQTNKLLLTLRGHTAVVRSVAWSADGKMLASGSQDRSVKVWNALTGQLIRSLEGHASYVNAIAWSPDGRQLASGSEDRTAKIWNLQNGEALYTMNFDRELSCVDWSPNGTMLAAGCYDAGASIKIFNTANGEELISLKGIQTTRDLGWSPDGTKLATASDSSVKIWDPLKSRLLHSVKWHSFRSVDWTADGKFVLAFAAHDRGTLMVVDALTGSKIQKSYSGYDYGALIDTSSNSGACSSDGVYATAGNQGIICFWHAKSLTVLKGHTEKITSISWNGEGDRLASASRDETVRVWDAKTGALIHTLRGHVAQIQRVVFSLDGKMLASASYDRSVKIWNAESGRLIKTLEGHGGNVFRVTWSPDGRQVASASDDKTIRVWDLVTGEVLHTLSPKDHPHPYWAVSWSPDGKMLASGTLHHIHIWNPETGELIRSIKASTQYVMDLVWNGDSKKLACGSDDSSVKIWDPANGQLLQSIKTSNQIYDFSWSLDGKRIATTRHSQPQIWDAKKGTLIRELRSLEGKHNYGIAFSPGGKQLAVGGDEKIIRIWELPD